MRAAGPTCTSSPRPPRDDRHQADVDEDERVDVAASPAGGPVRGRGDRAAEGLLEPAPTGVRNRALIAVLWRCGLRISEALSLELRDVDLQAGTVRVRHGKGDRSRTVGLDEQTTALLARWLDRRKKLSPGARAPIFCTLQGGRIDSSYVRRLLPRLAAKAGIDRRVHAHGLRHTHAAELAREGTPINIIRDDLGHTSLAVTDRYLRDVAPQAVIDTIRARRWPSA